LNYCKKNPSERQQIQTILLTQTLSIMPTIPLIFPCIFSDEQFKVLDHIRHELADHLITSHVITCYSPKSITHDLAQTIFDIREIMAYRNKRGYKFNSYVLRMAMLKLTFISETLSDVHKQEAAQVIEIVDNCIRVIYSILLTNYTQNQQVEE
jgi:hypothetical protein